MSGEQEPKSSEAECSARGHLELEDEEYWLYKDDKTHNQEDSSLLGHTESFLYLKDVLQEKVSSADDRDFCQSVSTREDDDSSHSDSDTEDNIKVIIGSIKTNPEILMEMLANQNSQTGQDIETSASDSAINTTTD